MKKSTIALIVAAVVCLGLSAFSAKASVTRTNEAIEEIGEVTYSEDCKAKDRPCSGVLQCTRQKPGPAGKSE